jgi:flagellar biosynthesis protein FlhF
MMTKTNGQNIEAGIHDLKVLLLENLRNKEGSALADLPKHLVPIERQLRLTGFDDTYIAQLMKDLATHECGQCSDAEAGPGLADHFRNLAVKWVFDRIKISATDHLIPGQTAIQVFVGAPGVGKTTAVAKLAARYHHREKKKVLLISLDTQRLAAAEQMRVFAKILDVPFMVIDSTSALEQVILDHRDIDLAFVDTPGCTFKDQVQMQQILGLQKLALPLDVTVVLSATEKESQSEKAIRSFAALGIHNLLFTKLDESWSFGEIFNLSYRWSLPLGFFSIGHQIPEHIEKASRERIIERLFDI